MAEESFEPPVVIKIYRLLLFLMPLTLTFPKIYRHTLGTTIQHAPLKLLTIIFEANATPRPLREAPLLKAQAQADMLKLLVRLCFELGVLKSTPYFQCSAMLEEIGKMLGGWIRYLRTQPNARLRERERVTTTAGRAPSLGFALPGPYQRAFTRARAGSQLALMTPPGHRESRQNDDWDAVASSL